MISLNKIYKGWYLLYILLIIGIYSLTMLGIFPEIFIHVPLILAFIPISFIALKKLKERIIGTEFFLTIATIISLIGHQEKAMNLVLIIMLIAEYLEQLISFRTEKEIKSLINIIPKEALIKMDNDERVVLIDEIKLGMEVIVKTGSRIPVDGIVIYGNAMVNESSLTGESIAKEKNVSDNVYAGTFIESGSLIIKTQKIGEDTFFGKIVNLVQKAEQKKAKVSILTDKIAFYLVPILLFLIGLTWLLTKNLGLVTTLLVFGSPLELTLITPLAILSGIIAAYKNGILVKGGLVLEKLSKSEVIFFDKTGTLTMGQPEVIKIETFYPEYNEQQILEIAAIAEKRSAHIFAHAILKKAEEEKIPISDPKNYISTSGHGIEILYNNEKWFLGNRHFLEATEHGNIEFGTNLNESKFEEYSTVYIGSGGKLYGKIYIADQIRKEAKKTTEELKSLGFNNIILLSGDKQKIATNIARQLGITKAFGDVFPDQKLLIIEEFQKQNNIVAMVGDGINDAPALKQADVGIAMGAMSNEPAIDAADIILVTNDLSKIIFVSALSKKIFNVIRQNLLYGFVLIHGLGIALTFLGFIDPFRAALFHAFSDIAILANSVKLINFKIKF